MGVVGFLGSLSMWGTARRSCRPRISSDRRHLQSRAARAHQRDHRVRRRSASSDQANRRHRDGVVRATSGSAHW